jgi:hypothetical protein
MKKLFVLLTISLTLNCCNKDDDNSSDTLPPVTQTGANTVGCLVNGKVFLPKNEGINPSVVVNYEFFNGDFFFNLRFTDQRNGSNEGVRLRTQRIDLQVGETYILNLNTESDGDFTGSGGEYQTSVSNEYLTTTTNTGELTITRLDLSNSIISGTFWFDAINEQGDIVEIRDGRFDYVY